MIWDEVSKLKSQLLWNDNNRKVKKSEKQKIWMQTPNKLMYRYQLIRKLDRPRHRWLSYNLFICRHIWGSSMKWLFIKCSSIDCFLGIISFVFFSFFLISRFCSPFAWCFCTFKLFQTMKYDDKKKKKSANMRPDHIDKYIDNNNKKNIENHQKIGNDLLH